MYKFYTNAIDKTSNILINTREVEKKLCISVARSISPDTPKGKLAKEFKEEMNKAVFESVDSLEWPKGFNCQNRGTDEKARYDSIEHSIPFVTPKGAIKPGRRLQNLINNAATHMRTLGLEGWLKSKDFSTPVKKAPQPKKNYAPKMAKGTVVALDTFFESLVHTVLEANLTVKQTQELVAKLTAEIEAVKAA